MRKIGFSALTLLLCTALPLTLKAAGPEAGTLIVFDESGKPAPGLAKAWQEEGEKLIFELRAGVDGEILILKINERLPHLKAEWNGKYLALSGIPVEGMFEQLSFTVLEGEMDPLAGLSGLGDSVAAFNLPEAGGSIRASKPMPEALIPKKSTQPAQPKNVLRGKVLGIERGEFPHVTLTIEIASVKKAAKGKRKLKAGKAKVKRWKGPVVFVRDAMGIDLRDKKNQSNLSALYLRSGDEIKFVPIFKGKRLVGLDFVERL